MATLAKLGVISQKTKIRFVGEPTETTIRSSDGETYFEWRLDKPINVRCSTEPEMEPLECESLFLRQSTLERDDWEVDDQGMFIEGWVADFSRRQEQPLYLEKPISVWIREDRRSRGAANRASFLDRIRERRIKK